MTLGIVLPSVFPRCKTSCIFNLSMNIPPPCPQNKAHIKELWLCSMSLLFPPSSSSSLTNADRSNQKYFFSVFCICPKVTLQNIHSCTSTFPPCYSPMWTFFRASCQFASALYWLQLHLWWTVLSTLTASHLKHPLCLSPKLWKYCSEAGTLEM